MLYCREQLWLLVKCFYSAILHLHNEGVFLQHRDDLQFEMILLENEKIKKTQQIFKKQFIAIIMKCHNVRRMMCTRLMKYSAFHEILKHFIYFHISTYLYKYLFQNVLFRCVGRKNGRNWPPAVLCMCFVSPKGLQKEIFSLFSDTGVLCIQYDTAPNKTGRDRHTGSGSE